MTKLKPLQTITFAILAPFIWFGASASAQESLIGPITPETAPTTTHPVPPVVEAWMNAWNTGDAKAMRALFAEDGVLQDFAFQAQAEGREGVAAWVDLTLQSIPDTRVEIIEAFGSDERIAVTWVFSGTPESIGTVPGTGASFSVPAVSIFELEDDLIVRLGDYYNRADLLGQLGYPDPFAESR